MNNTDEEADIFADVVTLSRLALAGRPQDVQVFIRRLTKRYNRISPDAVKKLNDLLKDLPTRSSPLRKEGPPAIPVDLDSRLKLVRMDLAPAPEVTPIFTQEIQDKLNQVLLERRSQEVLEEVGLSATKTVLFTGPPGVGKSLAARWLAHELNIPLLTLDLSALMSSFLGRTGNNVRHVMDYAKTADCVLLLDELDAIAKRRDDATEVGELKRLVTVLLQEIDDWPSNALLVAATNHEGLLDPAVWRRFDVRVDFSTPDAEGVARGVQQFLGEGTLVEDNLRQALELVFDGASFSDIKRELMGARRAAAIYSGDIEDYLRQIVQHRLSEMPRRARAELAAVLCKTPGMTQRQVHQITGVSRDTIRKRIKGAGKGEGEK